MVAEVLVGLEFPPEEYGRDAVSLEAHSSRETVLATPERVDSRRRPVPGVVVTDAMSHTSSRSDHDVGTVHRVEVVLGSVLVKTGVRLSG